MKRAVWLAVALGCHHGPPTSPGFKASGAESVFRYTIDVSHAPMLTITGTLTAAYTEKLSIFDDLVRAVQSVEVQRDGAWESVALASGEWTAPECKTACTFRYTLDLSKAVRSMDGAAAFGPAYIAPSYAFLMHPNPIVYSRFEATVVGRTTAEIDADGFAPTNFVTGLRRTGPDAFRFTSSEFGEGSYAAFGAIRTHTISVEGAEIDVALLGTPTTLAMGEPGIKTWVTDAAKCLMTLYGRFPIDHAAVFVLPVDSDDIVYGKVLSLAGAGIAIFTGDTYPQDKTQKDWVLVHEMVHLGFPTIRNAPGWMNEGLATYYEPILRTRMGWREPEDMWRAVTREQKRGIPKGGPLALDQRDTIDDIYWGGDLWAMMSDVRIRAETNGAYSLDDAMRAILTAGGDCTHVWDVEHVLEVGDAATGTHVLSEMWKRYGKVGEKIDLEAEHNKMGIVHTGKGDAIRFVEDAPWARYRRDITQKVAPKH